MTLFLYRTLLVSLLTLFVANCSSVGRNEHFIIVDSKAPKGKFEFDEIAAERGHEVYKTRCMACHGSDGRGTDLKIPGFKNSPPDLVAVVRKVPSVHFLLKFSRWTNMPGWEEPLSDSDVSDLTHYLKKLALAK